MLAVEGQFVLHPEQHEQGGGQPGGQPGQVEQGIDAVAAQGAQGEGQVVVQQHRRKQFAGVRGFPGAMLLRPSYGVPKWVLLDCQCFRGGRAGAGCSESDGGVCGSGRGIWLGGVVPARWRLWVVF